MNGVYPCLHAVPSELDHIIDLAHGAAAIVSDYFGRTARLTKRGEEAVTEADRASQRFIIAGLRRLFPNDGIIGEENDNGDAITCVAPLAGVRTWVIDPIDGTNNFVAGLGNFAICIGLIERGMPTLGVVHDVCRKQTYAAAAGCGATLDGKAIRTVASPLSASSLMMMTSNLLDAERRVPAYFVRWLRDSEWKLRVLGSAALEAVQVAAGVAHGAITINGKLWDLAAPAAILLEAGAVISDLTGRPIFPYEVAGYCGDKVPFLAAAPQAFATLLAEVHRD
jgi:myo-inositol-1(or 4)-monophosphatase